MKQKRLLSMLVLLAAVVSGAWAQPWTSGDCTVTFSDGVMTVSGTGAMADYEEYNNTPWSSYDVKTIVIESGVTSIGVKALSSCSKLESVSIPASVTSIGNYAFEACGSYATALTVSFAEGSKLLTIGEEAFRSANLKSIDIPNSVTSIGRSAFSGCSNLESVSIPASVTSIGVEAFYNCGMLAKVSIYAPSLTTYGAYAFHENAAGRKIYVLSDAVDTYKVGWSAYAADIEAMPGYTVSLKDGTQDADKWTVKAGTDGSFQSLPLEGVKAGTKVKLKYDGDRSMVKGVTAVKKAAAPATITVTWNNNDITGIPGPSFTKDDVTITADMIDFNDKNFMMGGTFTTTLGNFTKIEVTGSKWDASGTGWSGSTWTGNASSVSYNGSIRGDGMGTIKFVFTIEPKKSAYEHSITIAVDPSTTGHKATAPAMTIEFNTGETWADVAARYDWLDTYDIYTVYYKDNTLNGNVYDANGGVTPNQTIDPNGSYHWGPQ